MFEAELRFPRDYPLSPPKVSSAACFRADGSQMKFNPPLFHPNSQSRAPSLELTSHSLRVG